MYTSHQVSGTNVKYKMNVTIVVMLNYSCPFKMLAFFIYVKQIFFFDNSFQINVLRLICYTIYQSVQSLDLHTWFVIKHKILICNFLINSSKNPHSVYFMSYDCQPTNDKYFKYEHYFVLNVLIKTCLFATIICFKVFTI